MNNTNYTKSMNLLSGLAGVSVILSSTAYGSGQFPGVEEISEYKSSKRVSTDIFSPISNYKVNFLTKNYDFETSAFIKENDGLEAFLNKSIVELQSYFKVFSHKVDIFSDPNEDYKQLKVTIYTVDEDKIDKFCDFIDSWVEILPETLNDKIVFEIG